MCSAGLPVTLPEVPPRGTSMPSALAICRLMANTNLVHFTRGRQAWQP